MESSRLVFAVLPDTQYYSEGAPYIFDSQTTWLANNSHLLRDAFILHLGDIVQKPTVESQWIAGSEAIAILEQDGIHYTVAPGNHDVVNEDYDDKRNSQQELYLQYFSSARASMMPTFGGRDVLGYSEFHTITRNGMEFLIMSLDWRASAGTIAWARAVLDDYSTTPTILMSHEFLAPVVDPPGGAAQTSYGRDLWDQLIKTNNEVFLVICGHISASRYRIDQNDYGNDVVQILVNYQNMHAGGNGYMRLIEFDFWNSTMEHLTFSPSVMELYKDQGRNALGPNDIVELTDPSDKFVVEFDFVTRFREIKARVPDKWANDTSLLDSVRYQIATVPSPPTGLWPEPSGPGDFVFVEETLAHWRFDGNFSDGEPLAPTHVIQDLTGFGNDMYRSDVGISQADYLTWSNNHHRLSASPGSVCFSNPNRSSGGFLTTLAGAPLSSEVLHRGFTIEAFAQLAPTWDDAQHRWTGIVSRTNAGKDAGKTEGDVNEPLALLGFSPWREAQFASFPDNLNGIVTSWSSPLKKDRWHHVAAVNDGHATRLYIDGYPARRDPVHNAKINGISKGMEINDTGWSIGSTTYDNRRRVFGGCIGEVRIVARALEPQEFLIARDNALSRPTMMLVPRDVYPVFW